MNCRECNGLESGFFNYQNLKAHYIETHFKHKLVAVLADIRDISFVLQLRKEMNVSVLIDIDEEENDLELKGGFTNTNAQYTDTNNQSNGKKERIVCANAVFLPTPDPHQN